MLVHFARKSSAKLFDEMRPWLVAHNAIILTVICAIVGTAMPGKAFSPHPNPANLRRSQTLEGKYLRHPPKNVSLDNATIT